MDLSSAFKSEVFRPIASIVLPGLLALGPFAIVLCNASDTVQNYFIENTLAAYLMLLGASTVFGMLLENIGSSIERGIDECMEQEYLPGTDEIWDTYLSTEATDTNGRRFLGTLVTRLKFVNSLIPALVVFTLGLFLLHLQVNILPAWQVAVAGAVLLTALVWLFRMSIELSEAASNTRQRILYSIQRHIVGYNPDMSTVGRHRHFVYVLAEVLTARVDQLGIQGKHWLGAFWWIAVRSRVWLASLLAMAVIIWFAA